MTNVGPFGAKVSCREPFEVGTSAQLHFQRPDGAPVDVRATVSPADADGLFFAFTGTGGDRLLLP
jgi:hypothetical protein